MVRIRSLPASARLAGLVLAGLAFPSAAAAAQWTLAADVHQRVEADTNFGLSKSGSGDIYGVKTNLGLNLGMRTPTTTMNIRSGVALSAFGGSGKQAGLDRTDPDVSARIFHRGVGFHTSGSFDYSRTSVAFAQFGLGALPDGAVILPDGEVLLPDNTVVPVQDFETITRSNATRSRINARAGATLFLDPVNQLSFAGFGKLVRFSGDSGELVPTDTYGGSIDWGHDLTALTSTSVRFDVQRFTANDALQTESMSYSATAGFNTKLAPDMTFALNSGLSVTDTNQVGTSSNTAIGFKGSAVLNWKLADTSFRFLARQAVEPSSLGELQDRTTVALSVHHPINDYSNAGFFASYSRQTSTHNSTGQNTDRQLVALTPSYNIDLTRDWHGQIAYTLRLADDNGLAVSNTFFVTVSRTFDLLH